MLCYGQRLQRSQQEFFNLCKLETADLRPFLPDTGHLLLRVRADPQRSTAAEYSQHEMNGKHTHAHTMHSLQIGGWGGQAAAHQSFTFHVGNIINYKLEVCKGTYLEGTADSVESAGPVLNLILNGRQHLQRKSFIGHGRAFPRFSLSGAERN